MLYETVKNHVKRNQKKYIFGGIVVIAGVAYYVGVRVGSSSTTTIYVSPVFNNTVAPVVNNVVNNGGTLQKLVRNNATGMVANVTETAKAAEVPLEVMSKHINGYPGYEDIKGVTYTIIGIGTTG